MSIQTGKAIDPPLLMALDEPANSAPLPELDVVAATGAGQGIQLMSAFQGFAQVEARWGKRAATILNNHQAKAFACGQSDPSTLNYVSSVVRDGEFRQRSDTASGQGQRSSTESTTYRSLTPANVVREGKPGTALLIYGHRRPRGSHCGRGSGTSNSNSWSKEETMGEQEPWGDDTGCHRFVGEERSTTLGRASEPAAVSPDSVDSDAR